MVALANERPQTMRAYMYKKVDEEIHKQVVTIDDAPDMQAMGWRMCPIEFHEDESIRENQSYQHAAGAYCRDFNMQLNLHLLTEKHQVIGLAERCLQYTMPPKMSKGAMKRKFEQMARKMGVWQGDE